MDMVNTKIGMGIARDSASVITDKTFATSNMIGLASGVSHFTRSDNVNIIQQVKNTEKSQVNTSNPSLVDEQKKLKENSLNADISQREEKIDFSESFNQVLGRVSELFQTSGTKISFKMNNSDETAYSPVVIVTDKESGNVIRQIPSEEVLKFRERVKEFESAMHFDSNPVGLILDRQV